MKKRILWLLGAVAACGIACGALVRSGDLLIIAGDSITEQKQYSVFMEDYILMCAPQLDARVVQFGWSGDTAHGFAARQIPSLRRFKPQVVTTLFGMNDGQYAPLTATVASRYRTAMTTIVRELKKDGVRDIVVGTPGAAGIMELRKPFATPEQYNETLRQLGEIGGEVARAEGVRFVDVHTLMMDIQLKAKEKFGPKYPLCGSDGIHPAANGHLVMAYAFLKALEFDGNIGTITVDMNKGTAEATQGHEILGVSDGTVSVRSTRYPFCFYGAAKSPASPKGILEFLPFNAELNRYLLVVKNAPTPAVRVTWGAQSKTFSAEVLARGVNLADEFIDDNPFSAAFLKVHNAVRAQQDYETVAVKVLLQAFVEFGKQLPELAAAEQATFDRLADGVLQRSETLCARSAAAVAPVNHTIRLEPVER